MLYLQRWYKPCHLQVIFNGPKTRQQCVNTAPMFPCNVLSDPSCYIFYADIDECESNGATLCPKTHQECVNTEGGYQCNCLDGYEWNDDTQQCDGNYSIFL